ncbi:hypothetical protein Tco_1525911, partial [Tanacetum coccineum]
IAIPKITSATTVPPPPSSFIPLPQQTTPTPSPINSKATTSFTALLDFSSVFRFNDHGYISNKLHEAIQKAIKSHNTEFREEALADKKEYIDLVDTSMRTIISKEVKTQLPHILPQAVSEFATIINKKGDSSKDSRSKEKKSSSTSKDTSHSQHKSSGKSARAKEPSHNVDDLGAQQDQEFVTGNNDDQPADKEVSNAD